MSDLVNDGPVVYERDAVLTVQQMAEALQVSVRTLEKMDLPTIYCGKGRARRYLYGQVIECLRDRAA